MRDLTDNEKNIVENLLRLKQNHDLAGLQTAKILEQKSSNFLTIKWVSKDKHSLSIYYNANDANDEVNKQNRQKAFERYFEICDYLYFVRELVENKMVAIQTVFSKDPDKDIKILCNEKYITYKEIEDKFYLNSQLNSNITEELKPLTALHWSSQNIYTDIVLLLDNYLDRKIIYPLPLLDDFVKNGYKSIEERRYEEQMCWTRLSVFIAAIAVILTALFEGFNSDITIDENQLKKLEQVIIGCKTTDSDTIHIKSSDTLKIQNILQSE
mgnify:FL=1